MPGPERQLPPACPRRRAGAQLRAGACRRGCRALPRRRAGLGAVGAQLGAQLLPGAPGQVPQHPGQCQEPWRAGHVGVKEVEA